jgi:MFS family permease
MTSIPADQASMTSSDSTKDVEKDSGAPSPNSGEVEDEEQPHELRAISRSKSRDTSKLLIVKWDENDPENPFNFPDSKKWFITFQLGLLALAASLGSSITSPANGAIAKYVGVSQEASVLTVSLYVLGFALGPSIWAPISEIWGRRWGMLPAMVGLGIFSIGCAVSENASSVFVCRFFSGLFGSAPVSNVSAALGDIWVPRQRGTAVVFYAVAVVGGPTLGPTIGAALTVNPHLGWRWTEYILAIWTFATVAFLYFFFPEVYAPYLLKRRAQRLRKETGDQRYHHPHEDVKIDFNSIVTKHFTRPVRMLLTEPMVTLIAIYASFVFALLYMTLEFFTIVYHENRGWPLVTSTLPFIGLFVGVLSAVLVNLASLPQYQRAVDANGGKAVPEARLPPMIFGAVIFTIGLFVFGWTADPSIIWVPSVIAAGLIGAG